MAENRRLNLSISAVRCISCRCSGISHCLEAMMTLRVKNLAWIPCWFMLVTAVIVLADKHSHAAKLQPASHTGPCMWNILLMTNNAVFFSRDFKAITRRAITVVLFNRDSAASHLGCSFVLQVHFVQCRWCYTQDPLLNVGQSPSTEAPTGQKDCCQETLWTSLISGLLGLY